MTQLATEMYRHRADALATDVGEGPVLLCAHGTLMDRTMFRPQQDALGDDYRVVAYDLRARTEHWAGPYDLDDLADDCEALVDGLGLDRVVLCGMSMGGFMGLRFALRNPDRLAGLVLVDSMPEPHTQAEREQYGGFIDELPESEPIPEWLAETSAPLLFGPTTMDENEALVERWLDRWLTYHPQAVYHEVSSWLDRPGVLDRLDDLSVPTLVVHGEEDQSIDPERAEPVAEAAPDGRMVTVPGAGHSSNLERPGPVNDALRSFLAHVF